MQGMLRLAQQVLDTLILELLCKHFGGLLNPSFLLWCTGPGPEVHVSHGASWGVCCSALHLIKCATPLHAHGRAVTPSWHSRVTSCFCTLQHHDVSVVYTDFVSLDHSVQVEALECIIDDIHSDMHLITCRELLVTMA